MKDENNIFVIKQLKMLLKLSILYCSVLAEISDISHITPPL